MNTYIHIRPCLYTYIKSYLLDNLSRQYKFWRRPAIPLAMRECTNISLAVSRVVSRTKCVTQCVCYDSGRLARPSGNSSAGKVFQVVPRGEGLSDRCERGSRNHRRAGRGGSLGHGWVLRVLEVAAEGATAAVLGS